MIKIGIFIAFIDWQVQLDKRDLLQPRLQRPLFPDTIYFGTYYFAERNGTERLFRKIPILRNSSL